MKFLQLKISQLTEREADLKERKKLLTIVIVLLYAMDIYLLLTKVVALGTAKLLVAASYIQVLMVEFTNVFI